MAEADLLLSIAGPLMLAIAVYFLNSHQQRKFEKRKTAYHEKLRAFNVMNDALSHVVSNLIQLKTYTADEWQTETDQELEQSVLRIITMITLAGEDERAVEGTALRKVLDQYNKVQEEESPEARKEALTSWLVGSFLTLILLRVRLAQYYGEEFSRAFYAADILIDSDDVENAANAVNTFLFEDLVSWFQKIDRGPMPGNKRAVVLETRDLIAGLVRLEQLHKQLRDAMWQDLEATL